MTLRRLAVAAALAAVFSITGAGGALWATPSGASAQNQPQNRVQLKTVITVLPKHKEQSPSVKPEDVKIKVDGKAVPTEGVTPLRGDRAALELMFLIDSGARTSLGGQLKDLTEFIQSLAPTTAVGIAYMVNGQAIVEQPLTTDKARAAGGLHLPAGGAGASGSPYICLSDLARHWPSQNPEARREVVLITDGIDPYHPRFDPTDPYMLRSIDDSIRARIIVDALYWHNAGRASRMGQLVIAGQNLLSIVAEKTGGRFYYQGLGNPVAFTPFLKEIHFRLENQYELDFSAPAHKKPQIDGLRIKLEVPNVKLTAPRLIAVPAQ